MTDPNEMKPTNEFAQAGAGARVELLESRLDLMTLAVRLWRRRWVVVAVFAAVLVGSLVLSVILPATYSAKTTLIPVTNSASSSLSAYVGLAAAAGISLPSSVAASDPTQKIVAILQSRSLCESIVNSLGLTSSILRRKHPADPSVAAALLLQREVKVQNDDRTGLITVTAEFGDPMSAKRIADNAVEVLQATLNDKNLTVSKATLSILQVQIEEQSKKVADLQAKMAQFQRDTRMLAPDSQLSGAMALYSGLIQQKIALEVAISRLESALSPGNPEIATTQAQLEAVDAQISKIEGSGVGSFSLENAPSQLAEYQNLFRDLDLATKIYSGMLVSYDNLQLQAAQDQLFVEVIDPALPGARVRPDPLTYGIIGVVAGIALGVLAALLLDAARAFGRALSDAVRDSVQPGDTLRLTKGL